VPPTLPSAVNCLPIAVESDQRRSPFPEDCLTAVLAQWATDCFTYRTESAIRCIRSTSVRALRDRQYPVRRTLELLADRALLIEERVFSTLASSLLPGFSNLVCRVFVCHDESRSFNTLAEVLVKVRSRRSRRTQEAELSMLTYLGTLRR
jgi:hypothetical protein